MATKVALAYSGGLDTTAIVPWLVEQYGCEVVAFVGDVGQGEEELDGVEEKALRSGASSCYIVDLKDEFVNDYVLPTLAAGAVYERKYLLGTSMARPVLAKGQVELARAVGADALAHGCTGKGNDQVRFEATFAALAPHLPVIAPWREWDMRSREDVLEYIAGKGIPYGGSKQKLYSRDRNLWHVSHEGGVLEDPWASPPEDVWMLTRAIEQTPDEPAEVTIGFESGKPVSLNGEVLSPTEIIASLNRLGGLHGVGRIDLVENRLVGMKSRGCYETPGGTILLAALESLEEITLDRATLSHRQQMAITFSELVYTGQWFTPLREALSACAAKMVEPVTGEARVRLHKGRAVAVGRQSINSLYSDAFATFGADEVYDQSHAEGFIRLWSLPSRIAALRGQNVEAL